jgi:hypothetical protein
MKKKSLKRSPRSMLGLSVTFDLDQNTICDKGGAEYTSEADAYWYTNDRVRSMGMHTARKIKMYRQLLTILRRMPERSDQRRFLSSVLGEDEDGACIHGIEDLLSKVSLRRKIRAIRAVLEEQARQKRQGGINHKLIAMKSMKQTNPLRHRALQIASFHERDSDSTSSI